MKFAIGRELAQSPHQSCAMFVPARFSRDEINSLSHAKPN